MKLSMFFVSMFVKLSSLLAFCVYVDKCHLPICEAKVMIMALTLHSCFMSLKNLHVNLRTTFIGDGNVIFFPFVFWLSDRRGTKVYVMFFCLFLYFFWVGKMQT